MDRADKVKIYRKEMKSGRIRLQTAEVPAVYSWNRAAVLLLGLFAAGAVLALSVLLLRKKENISTDYAARSEFASLMSFLSEDDLVKQWEDHPDEPVTQGQIRDFLQDIGLSGAVYASGGNEKLSRAQVMEYYDQILDYLDLEESVQKDTVLLLHKDGNLCQTQDGELVLNNDGFEMENFYTYDVYRMDQTILGIKGVSDKTIAVRDVLVQSVTGDTAVFEYNEQEYKTACGDAGNLSAQTVCTLCIKNGRITKVKNAQQAGQDSQNKVPLPAQKKKEDLPDTVKVLLLNNSQVHYDQIYFGCDGSFSVTKNKKKTKYKKTDVVNIKKLKLKKGGSLTAVPNQSKSRLYLTDGEGRHISKGYYGKLTVYKDAEGYYIVNQVNVEKYLYSVTASEMPASFAEEALKAQAVCARSYVYRQMAGGGRSSYHADIDDSTNYQVYNKEEFQESQKAAVDETAGEVMYYNGEIINAYYYSASCGFGSGMEIWNQKASDYPYLKAVSLSTSSKYKKFDLSREKDFSAYIKSAGKAFYDSSSPYFRWTVQAEPSACLKELKQKIQQRYEINSANITFYKKSGKKTGSLKGFGGVEKISCVKRSRSGAVLELDIVFEFGKVKIKSEYNIRSILGCAMEKITYADGSTDTSSRFLPSAYFSISFQKKSRRYVLKGGGNGHGIGMSQYAADSMAHSGWNYKKILKFFYNGAVIKQAGGSTK